MSPEDNIPCPLRWSAPEGFTRLSCYIFPVLSKAELKTLKKAAASDRYNTGFLPCPFLYRNRNWGYFTQIHRTDGWMRGTIKDNNGDMASPLNGQLNGLFFCANVNYGSGRPPFASPFGSQRLNIPASVLINYGVSMYFADYYCLYRAHYVTLVLAKKGSRADGFCKKNLLQLNLNNNPFLRIAKGYYGKITVNITMGGLWVEVFYAHDLNIPELMN